MAKFPEGHRLFYVEEFGEPSDNVLLIAVVEAGAQRPARSTLLGEAVPILPLPDSAPLGLTFRHYVAYAVRNESYAMSDDGAPSCPPVSQRVERRNSVFLDFSSGPPSPAMSFQGLCVIGS